MFYYKVTYWDELHCKNRTDSGLVSAKSYVNALEQVLNYYDATVNAIALQEWETVLPEDQIIQGFEDADTEK